MSEVVEVTIYPIEELEGKAKEKAIETIADCLSELCNTEDLKCYFTQELEELGYPTNNINWSLGCCQGDGMAFYGKIENTKKVALTIGLSDSEAEYLKDYSITITKNSFGNHYSHYNTMTINEEDIDDSQFYELDKDGNRINVKVGDKFLVNKIYDKFREALLLHIKETSKRLEAKGYEIIEGNRSEEVCIEHANSNDYRFTEDGKVWNR